MDLSSDIELHKTAKKVARILEKNFSNEEQQALIKSDKPSLSNVREILDTFKEHIGEEHYHALAKGPAFSEMLDRWMHDRTEERVENIWCNLKEKLPESDLDRINRHDLKSFLFVLSGV